MPAWDDLVRGFNACPVEQRVDWLVQQQVAALTQLAALRGGRHVILYGSAFLQKPQAPAGNISITHEDVNGLMSVIYGMDARRGLTLVLHTPGGQTNATETIVAYLRAKVLQHRGHRSCPRHVCGNDDQSRVRQDHNGSAEPARAD